MKRSWRHRLLGRLVCARRGHRPVPFRTEPKHPGLFCSRCLEVRGGGRWVIGLFDEHARGSDAWPWYAPGQVRRARSHMVGVQAFVKPDRMRSGLVDARTFVRQAT